MSVGNGPRCPIDPRHGRLYSWERGGDPLKAYFCNHGTHGPNGHFFTDKEANGEYELKESDVSVVYEGAARDVIAGKITLDHAVINVASTTGRPSQQVREAITVMIDTIREKDINMATKKTAAAKAKTAPKPAGERRRLEATPASEFERVKNELGLTNKQAAEATGEAEALGLLYKGQPFKMGASATYIYILLHEGASTDLFAKYEIALRSYVKRNKIKRPKVAKDEAQAVVAEATEDEAIETEVVEDTEAETAEEFAGAATSSV